MASAWSCQHAEGLAVVRRTGPAGFYRWRSDGGAGHMAQVSPGSATQGRPAHPHAPPQAWPGTTCPHPVKCTGQTGATVRSHLDSPSVIPRVCRAVAAEGQCQPSGLRGRGTGCSPRRITRYGPAGGFQVVVGCAGWLCVGVLASVWCGSIGARRLCGWCCPHPMWRGRGNAIHQWGLAGAGRIAPIFFRPGSWLGRIACLYLPDTPQLCGP